MGGAPGRKARLRGARARRGGRSGFNVAVGLSPSSEKSAPPAFGSPGQRAFTSAARTVIRGIFRTCVELRVEHLAPIPRTGSLILAANHISHFDPPLLGAIFPRHVDWMAMEELFRHERFARALELTGAFPVNRDGSDRTALRTAVRRLAAGRCVGIFPEGGIRAGDTSIVNGAPMRPGVGMLALLARTPIVPALVLGTDRLYHRDNWKPFRRPPVRILTGAPIPPEGTREAMTAALSAAIVTLRDEAVRRFALRECDLPQTPQARKGEDPYAR